MAYHPWVNVTFDLVSRINIKSGAYLQFFLRQEFEIWCGCINGWESVAFHFWVYVTLTTDLVFRIFLSRAYLISSS